MDLQQTPKPAAQFPPLVPPLDVHSEVVIQVPTVIVGYGVEFNFFGTTLFIVFSFPFYLYTR